jgi:amidophosphoribosyltransferase
MGAELAREHPVDADMVIGVPDSATAAAVGYAQETGIPYGEGLVKNRYVGRTFIEPTQYFRDLGVRRKLNPLSEIIRGKRLVVVDDSIVRGTTTPHVVRLLRKGGAAEIHLRITAPPIVSTCHFGVDMATKKELIAANMSVEAIRQLVGADSLGYLSVEGLSRATEDAGNSFCMGCFTGEYPIPVQLEMDKLVMEAQEFVADPPGRA